MNDNTTADEREHLARLLFESDPSYQHVDWVTLQARTHVGAEYRLKATYAVADALLAAGFGDVTAERERANRLQRIIDGYDRTPAESRAAHAEAEVRRLQARSDAAGDIAREYLDDEAGAYTPEAEQDFVARRFLAALTEDQPAETPKPFRLNASSPHSRACGPRRHEHGYDCHSNCPTCAGVPLHTPEPPHLDPEHDLEKCDHPNGFYLGRCPCGASSEGHYTQDDLDDMHPNRPLAVSIGCAGRGWYHDGSEDEDALRSGRPRKTCPSCGGS